MKKLFIFIACTLSLGACNMTGGQQDAVQQERDSLKRIINEKDMELDDILTTFNAVQENIRKINEAEGRVTIAEGGPESADAKEVIRDNLDFIQQTLQQNRELIAQLQQKLDKSSIKNSQLQKTIENTTKLMKEAAKRFDFLQAAQYRDEIIRLQQELELK